MPSLHPPHDVLVVRKREIHVDRRLVGRRLVLPLRLLIRLRVERLPAVLDPHEDRFGGVSQRLGLLRAFGERPHAALRELLFAVAPRDVGIGVASLRHRQEIDDEILVGVVSFLRGPILEVKALHQRIDAVPDGHRAHALKFQRSHHDHPRAARRLHAREGQRREPRSRPEFGRR